jgi:predicted dehydrogenase
MQASKLLVLGTGGMAAQHVLHFRQDSRAEIVACADVQMERAESFAKTHRIAKAFGSLEDAIAWGGFDAAANVTPDSAHHPTTMKLIAAGKHVLCEKPLAESFALASEMAEAAGKAGVCNMVNLTYRNVAALETARLMIAGGDIGEVRHVEASYRQSWLAGRMWGDWRTDPKWLWRLSQKHGSTGVLGDVGIHILDFATHAIGMMPVSLQARLKTFHKAEGDRIGEYPLDANDSATMSVEFSNGALGVIHASRFMTGYANTLKLDVFGAAGALRIEHGPEWTEISACTGEDIHTLAWRRVAAKPVETVYRQFIAAIGEGKTREPSFRHAANLQKIIDLCYEAEAAVSIG